MIIGFDFETDPFGPRNLAPEPVCLSYADETGGTVVASCEPEFDDVIEHALQQEGIVTANGAFDMAVILARRPKLAHLVWRAYDEERVYDILIREQLKVLGTTGDLEFAVLSNGAKMRLQFSQGALEKKYLGIDRADEKDDEEGWRRNYSALRGMPASDYPADAYGYSRDDAVNALAIFSRQQEHRDLMKAQHLNARAALALYLNSCWGFPVDREMVEKLYAEMAEKFNDRHFQGLISFGILRPAEPTVPYVKQLEKAIAAVGSEPADWTPHIDRLTALGIKFKAPKDASINETLLRAMTEKLCIENGVEVRRTDTGLVGFGEEVQVDLKGLDPTFDEFIARNEIKKLVTTTLPMMRQGRNHPRYRVLVKTSRTSSFGNSKKDKNPAYPSGGIQQVDPRIREAYVADPGHVLCSIDYNFIELVSAAQKCLDLFGQSVLADKINAGYDPHAYLGAGLARKLEPGGFKWSQFDDENYHSFLEQKKTNSTWFKHWRNLAKPTGLGLPGGLGALRFVAYAKGTFGVDLVKIAGSKEAAVELAKTLKQEWLDLYPEFRAYFEWVNRDCIDVEWTTGPDRRYCYVSPHGTVRRNCFYTECANGAALQTATAEGAKIALYMLAKAMHDSSVGSSLLGCHQVAFVHDEVILQLPLDDYVHERAFEAARLWRAGMSQVMAKVKVGAEPALMMRWNKAAEPTFKNDRLVPWFPTPKTSSQPPASSATPSMTR